MQIQIINVEPIQKSTAKGRGYVQLEVSYKNLTYGNKVESRKVMPWGAGEKVHKIFTNATPGQVYETVQQKNDNGFNEFTEATLVEGGATQSSANAGQRTGNVQTNVRANTFETPEERAKKQVYIVRQSSIASAINLLSVGSKTAPTVDAVIDTAKKLEGYVFGIDDEPVKSDTLDASGFGDMDSDIPF